MKFWNYIGEFLLFRWLFGSLKRDEAKCKDINPTDNDVADDADSYSGFGSRYDNSYSRYDRQDYGGSQSYDDFLDEQDDYDMMDDEF